MERRVQPPNASDPTSLNTGVARPEISTLGQAVTGRLWARLSMMSRTTRALTKPTLILAAIIVLLVLAYWRGRPNSEPFLEDETRHVMTGVFFRDFLRELPLRHLVEYTTRYYLQYPALSLFLWPPFFYFLEGLVMSVFGTSMLVAKGLILFFAVLACSYVFRLVNWTHDAATAATATLIFGFTPLVFAFSEKVMLEIPALALALMALYHFLRYLDRDLRRDLVIATLASVLTCLTRYDGSFLAILMGIVVIARKRLDVLRRREVILCIALAAIVVLPIYGLSARFIGGYRLAILQSFRSNPGKPSILGYLTFYPTHLPIQLGWPAFVLAIIGLASSLRRKRWAGTGAYWALATATYSSFTLFAIYGGEVQSRHSIFWVPAFAFFAAEGIRISSAWVKSKWFQATLASTVIVVMAAASLAKPQPFLRGYEEAARYVVANSKHSQFCFFDGDVNGDFTYEIRRNDPDRRLWVARGDKLLYGTVMDARVAYTEFAATDADILAVLSSYNPEYIVVESPPQRYITPMSDRLRRLLDNNPDRFKLERVFPVNSPLPEFRRVQLKVYKKNVGSERPANRIKLTMLGMGRSFETEVSAVSEGK